MDEVLKLRQQLEELGAKMAGKETKYQIIIAILIALAVVSFMAKHFKNIHEAMPSIRKALAVLQKKWFRRAMFEKDVIDYMEHMKDRMEKQDDILALIKHEVMPNGQSSMNDAVRRTEAKVDVFTEKVEFNEFKLDTGFQLGGRMYAVFNRDAECIEVNPVFLRFFGCTMDEVLRGNYENLVHEDDRHKMQIDITRAIDRDSEFKLLEVRMFDCSGKEHKLKITGFPNINKLTGEANKYFVTFEILKQ